MNTGNSKTNASNKFIYQFTDKLNLKTPNNKNIGLVMETLYYTWKNIKSAYNNNKFKISASTSNDEFDLSDGSYSISDIPDYFEFIIKKHETLAENSPIQIYLNKIKNNYFQSKNRLQTRIVISRNNETIREYKKRCWSR